MQKRAESWKVKTVGFDLHAEDQQNIDEALNLVVERAPSDAYLTVTIVKTPLRYETLIEITSATGHFVAANRSNKLSRSVGGSTQRLLKVLNQWKKYRTLFSNQHVQIKDAGRQGLSISRVS